MELPDSAACAGKTLASLQIRSRFGCTIVEIDRQGYIISGPESTVSLFPKDRLLLLGEEEQISAARAAFSQVAGQDNEDFFDDSLLDTVTVPENSGLIGKPLRDLHISSRTGTVVVGIIQDGKKQVNPTGSEIVKAGDEWLVVGSSEELRTLRDLLKEGGV